MSVSMCVAHFPAPWNVICGKIYDFKSHKVEGYGQKRSYLEERGKTKRLKAPHVIFGHPPMLSSTCITKNSSTDLQNSLTMAGMFLGNFYLLFYLTFIFTLAFRAWSRSLIKSSTDSRPIDSRIRLLVIPSCFRTSSGTEAWVINSLKQLSQLN